MTPPTPAEALARLSLAQREARDAARSEAIAKAAVLFGNHARLADAIGHTRRYVLMLAKGQRPVSDDMMDKVVKALNFRAAKMATLSAQLIENPDA